MRAHTIVYEALYIILWQEFEEWLKLQPDCQILSLNAVKMCLDRMRASCDKASFEHLIHQPPFRAVEEKFCQFVETEIPQRGPLAVFWMSYVQLVNLVLLFVRATKEEDWMMFCL